MTSRATAGSARAEAPLAKLQRLQRALVAAIAQYDATADGRFDEPSWLDETTSCDDERMLASNAAAKLLWEMHHLGIDITQFGIKADGVPEAGDTCDEWWEDGPGGDWGGVKDLTFRRALIKLSQANLAALRIL